MFYTKALTALVLLFTSLLVVAQPSLIPAAPKLSAQ
ncbi:MAG: hypothetical protein ACI9OO_001494, partial [Bacteroidia bacterium]